MKLTEENIPEEAIQVDLNDTLAYSFKGNEFATDLVKGLLADRNDYSMRVIEHIKTMTGALAQRDVSAAAREMGRFNHYKQERPIPGNNERILDQIYERAIDAMVTDAKKYVRQGEDKEARALIGKVRDVSGMVGMDEQYKGRLDNLERVMKNVSAGFREQFSDRVESTMRLAAELNSPKYTH